MRTYIDDSDLQNKNSCTPHVVRWANTDKPFIAKRCPLLKVMKGGKTKKQIFVTALRVIKDNSNLIIIVACEPTGNGKSAQSLGGCKFEYSLLMPFKRNYYPTEGT